MAILNSVALLLLACSICVLPTGTNAGPCEDITKAGLKTAASFYEDINCEAPPTYTIPLDACPSAKFNVKKIVKPVHDGAILVNQNVTLFIKDKSTSIGWMAYGDWWYFKRARCVDCEVSFMRTSFDAKKCISACDEAKRGNLLEFLSAPETCTNLPKEISEKEIGNAVSVTKEIGFYVAERSGCILTNTESKESFFVKHGCYPLPAGKNYNFKCYKNGNDDEFMTACDVLVESGDFKVAFYSDISCAVQTFAIPKNAAPGTKITAKRTSNTGMWVVRRGFKANFKTGNTTKPYDASAYNYDDDDADEYEVTAEAVKIKA